MKPLPAALKVWMDCRRIDSVVIMVREDALRQLADGGPGAGEGSGAMEGGLRYE